ncbi:hypothetical protein [Limnoglobus roseus]|uniref:Lipoprotein n=1 Tax=Limnoglobus roseus TaxID=2598579 RepID=A0A5C1APK6_9BACT|nr:hypothetical protein [Limnoglobus roseus]QEL19682.1 hypothetical protein PX52LOC_06761 [Limnoglobus roseus]
MFRGTRLVGLLAVLSAGCASVPPLDNPLNVRPVVENPATVSPVTPDANSYAEVWERVIDVLDDYFELKSPSRYAGYVETQPRIAPGYEQFWRPGSPDRRERLYATLQTVRNTAKVTISAGDRGGYKVYVEVWREVFDLARPDRALGGAAIFHDAPTVDRRSEIITQETTSNRSWVPGGRDYAFEQLILSRIQQCSECRK